MTHVNNDWYPEDKDSSALEEKNDSNSEKNKFQGIISKFAQYYSIIMGENRVLRCTYKTKREWASPVPILLVFWMLTNRFPN